MHDALENVYSDRFEIHGKIYDGSREKKSQILIPYTEEPDVGIGDMVKQIVGKREVFFKVLDAIPREGGTLEIGTKHPHLLTLEVRNMSSEEHERSNKNSPIINIGSIAGGNIQIGDGNTLTAHSSLEELVESVAKNGDDDAKSKLKMFFENKTVSSILGASAAALIGLL